MVLDFPASFPVALAVPPRAFKSLQGAEEREGQDCANERTEKETPAYVPRPGALV